MASKFDTSSINVPSLGRPSTVVQVHEGKAGLFGNVSAANPLPVSDFVSNVWLGNNPDVTAFTVRGRNLALSLDTKELLWAPSSAFTYLTAAETMDIVSDSTDDDEGGTGCLTILVEGLDANYDNINEIVTMDGTTPVVTVLSYIRLKRLVALTAGSGERNVGTITATASSAATLQEQMDPLVGVSMSAKYTVPAGHTSHVLKAEFNAARISGGQQPHILFEGEGRSGGPPAAWVTTFDKVFDTSQGSDMDVEASTPGPFGAKTDLEVSATSDLAGAAARIRIYLIEIKD